MADKRDPDRSKPLADRRAEAGNPVDPDDEPDFAEEMTPGPTDPPNAGEDAPGGEAEGYTPQTRVD
ncbi:hypothetical protein [Thermomonospora umbrina]|uniref:Uncharacterized protein n=1 Tax=Thermomonospora umbrina TaxID=111806 RepID=A0A3D9SYC9_9ACTN|nr:hypothetical protein [Thermomonospora umbrina]REE96621.1 hypothetical protein DFJ69_2060 [Thermomonospora umbrina]